MEKIGTLRFDKSNFLGKGGFGKVYQGSYKLPGGQSTTVAVKQILQKDFRPVEDRLLRESMRHDNIVAYLAKEEDALS